MPDLNRFFEIAAGLLRPGGHILIYETHPFLRMFDPDSTTPHIPAFSYFKTQPHVESGLITYDEAKITKLEEFPHSIREVEYDIFAGQSAQLPMCYLLQALKP